MYNYTNGSYTSFSSPVRDYVSPYTALWSVNNYSTRVEPMNECALTATPLRRLTKNNRGRFSKRFLEKRRGRNQEEKQTNEKKDKRRKKIVSRRLSRLDLCIGSIDRLVNYTESYIEPRKLRNTRPMWNNIVGCATQSRRRVCARICANASKNVIAATKQESVILDIVRVCFVQQFRKLFDSILAFVYKCLLKLGKLSFGWIIEYFASEFFSLWCVEIVLWIIVELVWSFWILIIQFEEFEEFEKFKVRFLFKFHIRISTFLFD